MKRKRTTKITRDLTADITRQETANKIANRLIVLSDQPGGLDLCLCVPILDEDGRDGSISAVRPLYYGPFGDRGEADYFLKAVRGAIAGYVEQVLAEVDK